MTAVSWSFGQDPAPPARTASNRAIVIRKTGSSYLGIGVAEVDSERAKALNLKEARGVEVKSVDRDSPAGKAGLKESDVVLEYNGQRIEGTEQFVRLVRETPVDRQVKLLVWRNGGTQTLMATIGHRLEHFSLHTPDGGDGDFTLEIPPVPEMPEMPEMPEVSEMAPLAEVLRAHTVHTGMLGIEYETLGPQLAAFFGVKEGVLVRAVTKDSASEKAGMRAGDVIVKVDGEAVTGIHEIAGLVRAARGKRTFPVVIVRDKKELTLNVTL
jgi:serine protease Do